MTWIVIHGNACAQPSMKVAPTLCLMLSLSEFRTGRRWRVEVCVQPWALVALGGALIVASGVGLGSA